MDDRTAVKLFIRDITERPLLREEDGGPSYIELDGQRISTVRVMGVVVTRFDSERYTMLTIDDSTETMSIRAFGEDKEKINGVSVGDTIDVIGTLREYEEELYLVPRTIWRIDDPHWEIVRKLELLIQAKKAGREVSTEEVLDVEETVESDLKPLVIGLIERLDSGDGADYSTLLKESALEDARLDQTLNDLLSDSEIYEPKIGKFKKV